MGQQQLDRPGHRGRGRLVTGEQQGDELVAQLVVGHRLAVLVARADQHREDVVALGDVRVGAALADQRVERVVDAVARAGRRATTTCPVRSCCAGTGPSPTARRACAASCWMCLRASASAGPVSNPKTARRITSSVMCWNSSWSSKGSSRGQLAMRRSVSRRDELAVLLHPLAVERRQHELALAQVRGAVEQQDRVGAEDRLEEVEAAGRAGAQRVAVAGGDRLDDARVRHEDVRHGVRARQPPEREDLAVVALGLAQQRRRAQRPARAPGTTAGCGGPGGSPSTTSLAPHRRVVFLALSACCETAHAASSGSGDTSGTGAAP